MTAQTTLIVESVIATGVFGWLYSAFTEALPEPDKTSSKSYIFLYKFLHILAANASKVRGANAVLKAIGATNGEQSTTN
jgi:hypothetical protein